MNAAGKSPDDGERTAFRNAEKKYKLYYELHSRKRKQPKKVDLSQVMDFKSILETYNRNGELPLGVIAPPSDSVPQYFCLEGRTGFYFIPGALSIKEQCQWIKESLTSFPQPPNRTNHNALYGPIHNLFNAAKEHKVLVENTNDSKLNSLFIEEDACRWRICKESVASSKESGCKLISASVLLRKLRWSTLGLQFDWSKRNYDMCLPHNKIPDALCQLAKRMAAPAMAVGDEFKPEAAIVNYFGPGDTLGGHLDDMEADWSKPIVSLSLGCKAIFLLGGKTREDPPVAMFLRSGDVVLMAGEARECFHGVPRIFTHNNDAEITALQSQFLPGDHPTFLEYIRTSRININIRQVF